MKLKTLIIASAFGLTSAASAQAADIVAAQHPVAAQQPVPAVVAPTFSWTGFYFGGQIGGSWSDTKKLDLAEGGSLDSSGFIGGLYAGYNYDFGNNIVIGAETDWVWSGLHKTYEESYTKGYKTYEGSAKLKEHWAGATRVRVGYAMDRLLPYIAGGVAYAKLSTDTGEKTAGSDEDFDYDRASETFTGWTIGAGVDYALTQNVLLRVEYRYNDLSKKEDDSRLKYKTNDVRVGVAYKF